LVNASEVDSTWLTCEAVIQLSQLLGYQMH